MKNAWMLLSTGALALVCATACSSGRDVSVSGDATAADPTAIKGPITIQFFEAPSDGSDASTDALKTITLDKAGAFKDTVQVEGDSVRIMALVDANKDGKCSSGELWARVDAPIKNDTVENVSLSLSSAACPTDSSK